MQKDKVSPRKSEGDNERVKKPSEDVVRQRSTNEKDEVSPVNTRRKSEGDGEFAKKPSGDAVPQRRASTQTAELKIKKRRRRKSERDNKKQLKALRRTLSGGFPLINDRKKARKKKADCSTKVHINI